MEEHVVLDVDRRSVLTKAPVAVASTARLIVNDSHYAPPGGLYSQATLTGAFSGPYRIQRCTELEGAEGNVLTITTSTDTTDVVIPIGERVTLDAVLKAIRLSGSIAVAGSSNSGALLLMDATSVGSASVVRVGRPSGSAVPGGAAEALGFISQKGTRGRTVYPPWELHTRQDVYPSAMAVGRFPVAARFPKFSEPLKGNPTLKATYVSFPERCPRCQGTYVENDYRFDKLGDIITIDNENLLYQACLKMILTERGSNIYHPAYGSKIMNMIGRKRMSAAAMQIQEDVQNALQKVKNLQTGQRKFQAVTDREYLYSVTEVTVSEGNEDPTGFFVNVVVQNASGVRVPVTIAYSVPGAVALAGSTGESLGSQPSRFGPNYRELVGG
jgi:phage baseplate assembly protein W